MQPRHKLNYSALDNLGIRRSWVKYVLIGIVILLVDSALVVAELPMLSMIIFGGGSLYLMLSFYRDAKAQAKAIEEVFMTFAAANDFQFAASPFAKKRPGTIFEHGHSKKYSEELSGSLEDLPFEMFNYRYTTGYGKNSRDYDALVAELSLPRTLPHMIIDSVVESTDSVLPIQFDKAQKIELEGDFHKYFDLYAPDKYGVSALTVIAPDVMEVLMRYATFCDIEIIDNKLYFYWPELGRKRQHFEQAFGTIQEVLGEIGKKLRQSDIFAHKSHAQVHSTSGARGIRLTKSSWELYLSLVFIAICATGLVVQSFGETNYFLFMVGFLTSGLPLIIVIVLALLKAGRYIRKYRLKKELQRRPGHI